MVGAPKASGVAETPTLGPISRDGWGQGATDEKVQWAPLGTENRVCCGGS